MKITPEEVAHVARLARLELSPEQSQKLTGQMNDILTYMDKLGELDTSSIESTSHASELTGGMREDQVTNQPDRENGLSNAPASDGQSFIVPRVI